MAVETLVALLWVLLAAMAQERYWGRRDNDESGGILSKIEKWTSKAVGGAASAYANFRDDAVDGLQRTEKAVWDNVPYVGAAWDQYRERRAEEQDDSTGILGGMRDSVDEYIGRGSDTLSEYTESAREELEAKHNSWMARNIPDEDAREAYAEQMDREEEEYKARERAKQKVQEVGSEVDSAEEYVEAMHGSGTGSDEDEYTEGEQEVQDAGEDVDSAEEYAEEVHGEEPETGDEYDEQDVVAAAANAGAVKDQTDEVIEENEEEYDEATVQEAAAGAEAVNEQVEDAMDADDTDTGDEYEGGDAADATVPDTYSDKPFGPEIHSEASLEDLADQGEYAEMLALPEGASDEEVEQAYQEKTKHYQSDEDGQAIQLLYEAKERLKGNINEDETSLMVSDQQPDDGYEEQGTERPGQEEDAMQVRADGGPDGDADDYQQQEADPDPGPSAGGRVEPEGDEYSWEDLNKPQQLAYEHLGLSPDATEDEVKEVYRTRVRDVHPDQGGDQDEFQDLNRDYKIAKEAAKELHGDDDEYQN